jgi:hypothetical protein
VAGQAEHYDTGFRMDTAFLNRVGITRGWQYQAISFYPEKRFAWIKRGEPLPVGADGRDRVQGGSEQFWLPALRFNFTRSGYLRVDRATGTRPSRTSASHRPRAGGRRAQWTKWLNVAGTLNRGPAVFYDPLSPFQGWQRVLAARVGLQPSTRLSNQINYTFVHFERETTGDTVYDVHILNLRNTYQFNKQFLVRAITQYDSSRRACSATSWRRTSCARHGGARRLRLALGAARQNALPDDGPRLLFQSVLPGALLRRPGGSQLSVGGTNFFRMRFGRPCAWPILLTSPAAAGTIGDGPRRPGSPARAPAGRQVVLAVRRVVLQADLELVLPGHWWPSGTVSAALW